MMIDFPPGTMIKANIPSSIHINAFRINSEDIMVVIRKISNLYGTWYDCYCFRVNRTVRVRSNNMRLLREE